MSIGLSGFAINIPFCLYQLTTFLRNLLFLQDCRNGSDHQSPKPLSETYKNARAWLYMFNKELSLLVNI